LSRPGHVLTPRISTSSLEPLSIAEAARVLASQAAGLCSPERRALCGSDCCRPLPGAHGRVVAVTLPDLVTMARHLYGQGQPFQLQEAVEELLRCYCSLSPYTGAYMLAGSGQCCPFLSESGLCAVYEARPLLCRLFYHCEWIGSALQWDWQLDARLMRAVLALAQQLARLWPAQRNRLWRTPTSYEVIALPEEP
jgi:Fe-S-cluster containining protein